MCPGKLLEKLMQSITANKLTEFVGEFSVPFTTFTGSWFFFPLPSPSVASSWCSYWKNRLLRAGQQKQSRSSLERSCINTTRLSAVKTHGWPSLPPVFHSCVFLLLGAMLRVSSKRTVSLIDCQILVVLGSWAGGGGGTMASEFLAVKVSR